MRTKSFLICVLVFISIFYSCKKIVRESLRQFSDEPEVNHHDLIGAYSQEPHGEPYINIAYRDSLFIFYFSNGMDGFKERAMKQLEGKQMDSIFGPAWNNTFRVGLYNPYISMGKTINPRGKKHKTHFLISTLNKNLYPIYKLKDSLN